MNWFEKQLYDYGNGRVKTSESCVRIAYGQHLFFMICVAMFFVSAIWLNQLGMLAFGFASIIWRMEEMHFNLMQFLLEREENVSKNGNNKSS